MVIGTRKFLFLGVLMILIFTSIAMADESPGGYNSLRIENEAKIVVPKEIKEEVWNYLVDKYVNDTSYLKSLKVEFEAYWDNEYFIDKYFDSPSLQLMEKNDSVRHRKRWNLDDSSNRKNERELVQIKISDINDNEFSRGEIKYDVNYPKKIKAEDDMYPIIGIIDKDLREGFKLRLVNLSVSPYSLREIVVLNQYRRSMYITNDGQPFISIRLDEISSKILWVNWKYIEIEPELNEIPYTEGNESEKRYMEEVNAKIIEDLMNEFPELKMDLTPKYNKAFNYFENKIPFLRTMIKYNFI